MVTRAIADLDYSAAQIAVQHYVATHRERPQPADIRELVVNAALALPGPEEAWAEVLAAIASNHFSHAAIEEAIRLTGRSPEDRAYLQYDQYPWFRRQFLSCYQEVTAKMRTIGACQTQPLLPSREEARTLLNDIHAAGKKQIA